MLMLGVPLTRIGCCVQRISKAAYERRLALLSCTAAAWSPLCTADDQADAESGVAASLCCSVLAVGTKSGRIWLWRQQPPAASQSPTSPKLVRFVATAQRASRPMTPRLHGY